MSDAPVKKGRGRPAKAKTEAVVEKPLPKKVEKVVKEAPPAKEAPAKEENGAKKGRGRPPKATVAKKSPPKRAAPTASGKGRGRPPKAAKKQESADESADADSDS